LIFMFLKFITDKRRDFSLAFRLLNVGKYYFPIRITIWARKIVCFSKTFGNLEINSNTLRDVDKRQLYKFTKPYFYVFFSNYWKDHTLSTMAKIFNRYDKCTLNADKLRTKFATPNTPEHLYLDGKTYICCPRA